MDIKQRLVVVFLDTLTVLGLCILVLTVVSLITA